MLLAPPSTSIVPDDNLAPRLVSSPKILVKDTFIRPNSANSVGRADVTGQLWTPYETWGINSNQLYSPAAGNLTRIIYISNLEHINRRAGYAPNRVYSAPVTRGSAWMAGIVLQYSSINNYTYVVVMATPTKVVRIVRVTGGTGVAVANILYNWTDGHMLTVVLSGALASVYDDNTMICSGVVDRLLYDPRPGLIITQNGDQGARFGGFTVAGIE